MKNKFENVTWATGKMTPDFYMVNKAIASNLSSALTDEVEKPILKAIQSVKKVSNKV